MCCVGLGVVVANLFFGLRFFFSCLKSAGNPVVIVLSGGLDGMNLLPYNWILR